MEQHERDIEKLLDVEKVILDIKCKLSEISYDEYVADRFTRYGFERMVEIIGEACGKISKEFQQIHSGILWTEITGMRNKLAHDYFGIDYKMLWDTIHDDIPVLGEQIEKLLDEDLSDRFEKQKLKENQIIQQFFSDKPVTKVFVLPNMSDRCELYLYIEVDKNAKLGWDIYGWFGELRQLLKRKVVLLEEGGTKNTLFPRNGLDGKKQIL